MEKLQNTPKISFGKKLGYSVGGATDTLAYDYALELAHLAVSEMSKQGLTKKELAERMGVSPQRLANLLNTQPNMTLKSVAQVTLALGIRVEFSSEPAFSSEGPLQAR